MLTPDKKEGRYIGVLADGKFHESVDEGTEGAVLREYETSKGEKGQKHELVYSKLEGMITDIKFEDGEFGEQILTTFSDGETSVIVALNTSSNFGEDFLKKLPKINFAEKVKLVPYSFEDEHGKNRRGVTVYQNDEKVQSFFFDGEKSTNGYPAPEGDKEKYDSDDWKVFYIKARKFLVSYAKETVLPKFESTEKPLEYPKNEFDVENDPLNPKNIPF